MRYAPGVVAFGGTLIGCLFALQCATMPVVQQQGPADCMIASIAMFTGASYDVVMATALMAGTDPSDGMDPYETELVLTALQVDAVVDVMPVNAKAAFGILVVKIRRSGQIHAVVLHQGQVYDPSYAGPRPLVAIIEGGEWDAVHYFIRHRNRREAIVGPEAAQLKADQRE